MTQRILTTKGLIIGLLVFLGTPAYSQSFEAVTGPVTQDYPAAQQNAFGVNWVDFNNDHKQDLYFSNTSKTNLLFRQQKDTSFKLITEASTGFDYENKNLSTSWGDYDNDTELEAYLALQSRYYDSDGDGSKDHLDKRNLFMENMGNTTFDTIPSTNTTDSNIVSATANFGDYNNDGSLDVYVGNQGRNNLYTNNGDQTFTPESIGPGLSNDSYLTFHGNWVDYNNDGQLDLFNMNYNSPADDAVNLYQNNGDGSFTKISNDTLINQPTHSLDDRFSGSSWGDYDNDGDLDVFLTNGDGSNKLFQNNGDGSFTQLDLSTAGISTDANQSTGSAWADVDNDGYLDLYVSNKDTVNYYYLNDGDGTFTLQTSGNLVSNDREAHGCAFGDYNNDGFPDLAIANYAAPNGLFVNNGNSNNWLKVHLTGCQSNHTAYGAKVYIKANSMWQMRELTSLSGGGFGGTNSLTANFGVGTASNIDSVMIAWPGNGGPGTTGDTTVYENVSPNQMLDVYETLDGKPVISGDSLICESGGSITLNVSGSGSNATYTWYSDSATTDTITTGSTLNASNLTGDTTFYVTAGEGHCAPRSKRTLTLVSNPDISSPDTLMSDSSTVTLNGTGMASHVTYRWYTDADTTNLVGTGDQFTSEVYSDTTFYIGATRGGCVKGPDSQAVRYVDMPEITGDSTVCPGDSAVLNASGESGASYRWFADADTTNFLHSGADFTAYDIETDSTFYISAVVDTAASSVKAFTVTTNGASKPTISGDSLICHADSSITLNASGSGPFTWYSDSTAMDTIGSGSEFTTNNLTSDTTFYATANNGQCESETAQRSLILIGNPEISSPDTLMSDSSTVTLNGTGMASHVTYRWYTDADTTNLVGTGDQLTSQVYSDTTFYIGGTRGGCPKGPDSQAVRYVDMPEITGDSIVCPGDSAVLNASGESGASYRWFADADTTNFLHSGADFTAYDIENDSTFYISTVVDTAASSVKAFTVQTNQPAKPAITGDTAICPSGSATLEASGNGSITWYSDSTATDTLTTGSTMTQSNLSTDTVFYVTDNVGSCESPTAANEVILDSVYDPIITSPDTLMCGGSSVTLNGINAGSNVTYRWYIDRDTTSLIKEGDQLTAGPISQDTMFYVGASTNAANCVSKTDSQAVRYVSSPDVSGDFEACDEENTELKAFGEEGASYNWYADEATTNLIHTGDSLILDAGNITSDTSFFAVAIVDTCRSSANEVQITYQGSCSNTAINAVSAASAISVHPNPVSEELTVNMTLTELSDIQLRVYSTTGKQLKQVSYGKQGSGEHSFTLNVNALNSQSLYLLKIIVNGESINRKVYKK